MDNTVVIVVVVVNLAARLWCRSQHDPLYFEIEISKTICERETLRRMGGEKWTPKAHLSTTNNMVVVVVVVVAPWISVVSE